MAIEELQQCECLLRSQSKSKAETRWPKRTRQPVIGESPKMNRMSARETHLVGEEDLRDRVLIAGVRIVNVRFGLLQLCLT